jgi:hypothetical protein
MKKTGTMMPESTASQAILENQARDYQQFVRQRMRWALVLAVGVAFVLVLTGHKPEAKGVALGALFSLINFQIMARALASRIQRQGRAGKVYGFGWILLRMAVMAVPLVIAAKIDQVSLLATAAGLFAIQAVLFLEPITSRLTRR